MTPEQIANIATSHAAGLRATLRALFAAAPPPPSPSVVKYYEDTAAELEMLAPRARSNDPEAIRRIYKLIGRPIALTVDFEVAAAESAEKIRDAKREAREKDSSTPGLD